MKSNTKLLGLAAVILLHSFGTDVLFTWKTVHAAEVDRTFQQTANCQNQLVIEAENFHSNTPQGKHFWTLFKDSAASGRAFMEATPNNDTINRYDYMSLSPRLDFKVDFVATGTHYVWVRGFGRDKRSDSVHIGLNGVDLASSRRVDEFTRGSWNWSNQIQLSFDTFARAKIDVISPGKQTLNIWMREDGFRFDKVVLTTDPKCFPSGMGPEERLQGSEKTPINLTSKPDKQADDAAAKSGTPTSISKKLSNLLEINPSRELGLMKGESVCFRVKSYNNVTESDFSKAVCGKIKNDQILTLTWSRAPGDVIGYYVYFSSSTKNATEFFADTIEN